MLDELSRTIVRKEARLAVIGLGYVGLPVACEFARSGFNVLGVEVTRKRVDTINAGISPIVGKEPGLQELVAEVVASGRLRATWDYGALGDRDVMLSVILIKGSGILRMSVEHEQSNHDWYLPHGVVCDWRKFDGDKLAVVWNVGELSTTTSGCPVQRS